MICYYFKNLQEKSTEKIDVKNVCIEQSFQNKWNNEITIRPNSFRRIRKCPKNVSLEKVDGQNQTNSCGMLAKSIKKIWLDTGRRVSAKPTVAYIKSLYIFKTDVCLLSRHLQNEYCCPFSCLCQHFVLRLLRNLFVCTPQSVNVEWIYGITSMKRTWIRWTLIVISEFLSKNIRIFAYQRTEIDSHRVWINVIP